MSVNQEALQEHNKCHEHLPFNGRDEIQRDEFNIEEQPVENKIYYCHHHNTCTELFTENELIKHCKLHDIEIENPTAYFKKALNEKVNVRGKIEESCEICFELFPTKKALNLHYDIHDNIYKCVDCNEGFKKIIEYVVHTKSHRDDNMYQCPSCDAQSGKRFWISRHLQCHESYKRYKCQICEKRFSTYQPYIEHIKIYHEGEPPLSCEICGENFDSSRKLTDHKLKKHTFNECGKKIRSDETVERQKSQNPVNRYVCDTCGNIYTNKKSFRFHNKIHKDKNMFKCEFCDKKFISSSCKKKHELAHTEGRSYKCPHCNKCFTRRISMVIHSRRHTGERPFKCSFCDKKFISADSKNKHERTHTGYEFYKCPFCDKGFSQRDSLLRHSRLHTGERPYTCRVCSKSYTTRSTLQKHLKKCKDSN